MHRHLAIKDFGLKMLTDSLKLKVATIWRRNLGRINIFLETTTHR